MSGIKAYIGLGSNLGDGKRTLQDAWRSLGQYDGIDCLKLSSPYISAPVGMESDNWFTNAVGQLTTTSTPVELLQNLLTIEAAFGRRRPENVEGYQDRSLDLDLLYFGDIVMDTEELTLPHPQISGRLFVLEPLVELIPENKDQTTGKTPAEMIERLFVRFKDGRLEKQELSRSSWEL